MFRDKPGGPVRTSGYWWGSMVWDTYVVGSERTRPFPSLFSASGGPPRRQKPVRSKDRIDGNRRRHIWNGRASVLRVDLEAPGTRPSSVEPEFERKGNSGREGSRDRSPRRTSRSFSSRPLLLLPDQPHQSGPLRRRSGLTSGRLRKTEESPSFSVYPFSFLDPLI